MKESNRVPWPLGSTMTRLLSRAGHSRATRRVTGLTADALANGMRLKPCFPPSTRLHSTRDAEPLPRQWAGTLKPHTKYRVQYCTDKSTRENLPSAQGFPSPPRSTRSDQLEQLGSCLGKTLGSDPSTAGSRALRWWRRGGRGPRGGIVNSPLFFVLFLVSPLACLLASTPRFSRGHFPSLSPPRWARF